MRIELRTLGRWLAGGLALQLTLQPAIAAAQAPRAYDQVYARYLRGDASLGEVEAARRSFNLEALEAAQPQILPAVDDLEASRQDVSPAALGAIAGATAAATAAAEARQPGTLTKIASWVKDIPARTVRRWKGESQGFQTAEEANEFIENSKVPAYTANATQREAESDWKRPVLVTAQAEVNKVQAVIERVVAFGGITALTKAAGGDAASQKVIQQATQVVAKMTPAQKAQLASGLGGASGLGTMIRKMISGKPTSMLGRIVKDDFGNNILIAVAASGIVSAFLNDGLDLDTLKDKLVALNAIQSNRSRREDLMLQPLEAVAYLHMDKGASKAFQSLWSRATSGSGRLAQMLTGADEALTKFGSRFVKAPPAHLAEKAAAFGRQASSLGLPGVSGATSLSLAGMAEATFKAGTVGLIGMPLIMTGWRAIGGLKEGHYIGGSRDRIFARYDLYDTYYQRTGDRFKDALQERRVALLNLFEGYKKFPWTNALDYFFRFVGGYTGAVIASSIVAPVGIASFAVSLIVSAVFAEGGVALGKWLGAKLDTSGKFYERIRRANTEKIFQQQLADGTAVAEREAAMRALAELDKYRAALGVRNGKDLARVMEAGGGNAAELERLAQAYQEAKRIYVSQVAAKADEAAGGIEKLVRSSQANDRVKYVRSFDEVKLVQKGTYVQMQVGDESFYASPRYDIVTAEGRRGVWDYKTNRVIDVGSVHTNNGNRITFLDDAGVVAKDGVLQAKDKSELEKAAGNAFISNNGIVLEKGKKGEWLVRGYGGEYDIVLRDSGRRFKWDGQRYVEAGGPHDKPAAKVAEAELDAKAQKKAAKKADAKAESEARARAFSAKILKDLTASVAPTDGDALRGAFQDLGRMAKAQGSVTQRYAAALSE